MLFYLSDGGWIGILAGAVLFAALLTFGLCFFFMVLKSKNASKSAEQIIKEAKVKSEHILKNAEIDAKQLALNVKQKADEDIGKRKAELAGEEQKLSIREQNIDARDNALIEKENNLDRKSEQLSQSIESYKKRQSELDQKIDDIIAELEKVSGMSTQEAHDEIMARVESKMSMEIAAYIKNAEDEAKETAESKAIDLLSLACQRYAQDVTTERTVSVVALPSDEMKGRIIGREGRNIRVLEQELGVDLVIDDTPEAITVSCFDPIRREVARRSLEYLVKDGRIQPGRIEDVVAKCKKEVADSTLKYGEEACFKLGLPRINKELVSYIGRLHYRTSYGQNGLEHSMEVAYLTGIMAGELGLDVNLARRAGLLHDIGKSTDHEQEGSHVDIGVEIATKFRENPIVINAIASHHGDVEADNVISHLVAAADTLSAARPGARSESLDNYIKRLQQLEELSNEFKGVDKTYALQAGREVRIIVKPEEITDAEAYKLARDIKNKIETTMNYPGTIKVTVIRETRVQEVAR